MPHIKQGTCPDQVARRVCYIVGMQIGFGATRHVRPRNRKAVLVTEDLVCGNISACIFDKPFRCTGMPRQDACVLVPVFGQSGAGGTVEQVVCCMGDPNHALGASWMCDDGCSTCTCQGDGSISADGCGGPPTDSQPSTYGLEEHLVEGASLAALTCFVAFGAVCYIMCCCKRAMGPLPTKELEKNEEDEQLAAGD